MRAWPGEGMGERDGRNELGTRMEGGAAEGEVKGITGKPACELARERPEGCSEANEGEGEEINH